MNATSARGLEKKHGKRFINICGYKTVSEENLGVHLRRKQYKKKLESIVKGGKNEDFLVRSEKIEMVLNNYSVKKS